MSRTLTKRLEYVEQYEVLVGIDFGKRRNVAAVLTAKGQRTNSRPRNFSHSQAAYEELVEWVKQ